MTVRGRGTVVIVGGLVLGAAAAWGSWEPSGDTVHFGNIYYLANPGQLTQRYDYVHTDMRKSAPLALFRSSSKYSLKWFYSQNFGPDDYTVMTKRYKAAFGQEFDADKVLMDSWTHPCLVNQDVATCLLRYAEGHPGGYDRAELGRVVLLSDKSRRVDLESLKKSSDSQVTQDAVDLAIWTVCGDKKEGADELLAQAKRGSTFKAHCLVVAAGKLLMVDDLPDGGVVGKKPNVELARLVLWQLLSEFPNDAEVAQALGWMGFVHRWYGHEGIAAEWYLKQMIHSHRDEMVQQTIASLMMTLPKLKPYEAKWLNGRMRKDVRLAYPYIEFRMGRSKSYREVETLWRLADAVAESNHGAKFPARACGLFANLAFLEGAYSKADVWAKRATQTNDSMARAMGLSIQGAVDKKRGQLAASAKLYEACLKLSSYESLRTGAMENLAMVYEKQGRLSNALDMYFALGYMPDIAYMMDVRMTPRQLEKYYLEHPHHEFHGLVRYSLAMRYLRLEDFKKTHKYLDPIPDDQVSRYANLTDKFMLVPEDEVGEGRFFDPREVLSIMEQGRARVKAAKGREAKAAALFDLASTVYKDRSLMFYNAGVWQSDRVFNMYNYVVGIDYSATTYPEAKSYLNTKYWMQKGMRDGETVYHSYLLAKEVVDEYPETKVAAQAAYRAATSLSRLVTLNMYYGTEQNSKRYFQEASRLMGWIVKHHPESPLVKEATKFERVYSLTAKDYPLSARAFF